MKKVYGSYATEAEARKEMSHLYEQGYTREDIKIISNYNSDGNVTHTREDESMWDKIKDTFTPDDDHENNYEKGLSHEEKTEIEGYKSNIEAGEVVLLVEERAGHPDEGFNKDVNKGFNGEVTYDDDERVMELKKEKLNVDKEKVQTGEVDVKKVTKEETETVEVPVEKEEIVIERKSALGREVKDGEIVDSDPHKDDEEIHIPITEERVDVNKDTVVDDEVVIKKDKHRENKTFTEDVKHEDIEVEGDTELNEGLKDKNRRSEDL
ncbi:MAG TPA: DUF2382 domain-containing protein [Pseudogracilibacillus sp.]|nr:DUF2382 domain-containing protein [Pseudogracilibacillus sp.]